MAQIKMSWHAEGDRLADQWVESQVTESYNPPWMQSSYPNEASTERCSPVQSLSLFGKPRYSSSEE
jgi:hypothetical protein